MAFSIRFARFAKVGPPALILFPELPAMDKVRPETPPC
jgi:hypothetical protein